MRRSSGSPVTWQRAQPIPLSAQGMSPTKITEMTFASEAWDRDVLHNSNADGFDCRPNPLAGGQRTLPRRPRLRRRRLRSRPARRPTLWGSRIPIRPVIWPVAV
ncbi:conserved hypothetical protein [Parafrankia sp. Ea1.12]|nr:conserved hypothetical protein [Parafrankia sp. Ea1.12]